MTNPFKDMTTREWILWLGSLAVLILSSVIPGKVDGLSLLAACIGTTSLIFAARGNVWSQFLIIIFSILYGIISWRYRYFGEMVTYLGMTMPMAAWAAVTWLRNPAENGREVEIRRLDRRLVICLLVSAAIVTAGFYFILKGLGTPNIVFSTLSVTTSFLAAALTMLRSSWYALFYAMNDLVLIVLWVMATREDPLYFSVVVNFVIFFVNDMYGFVSWRKREKESKK